MFGVVHVLFSFSCRVSPNRCFVFTLRSYRVHSLHRAPGRYRPTLGLGSPVVSPLLALPCLDTAQKRARHCHFPLGRFRNGSSLFVPALRRRGKNEDCPLARSFGQMIDRSARNITVQLSRVISQYNSPEHQPGELGDENDSGIYSISP